MNTDYASNLGTTRTLLLGLVWAGICSAANAQNYAPPFSTKADLLSLTFDQTYYAQIHNTYQHSSKLTNWLAAGYRTVELDVIDRGNWENETNGPYVAHGSEPEDTNCSGGAHTRLGDCLTDILDWEASHRSDVPLVILVDMKASWDPASAWKADEVAMLDKWIADYLGNSMYKYTDLRTSIGGSSGSSMRALLKEKGWPTNASLRKKIIVGLTGGKYGDVNDNMARAYKDLDNAPSTFLCPDVDAGDPDEISGKIDSISDEDSKAFVCANMKAGKHMETSLDRSSHYRQMIHVWGASGDFANTDYAYNYMTVAHGGSLIGWDSTIDKQTDATYSPPYRQFLDVTGMRRGVPGYFELESIQSRQCVDVKDKNFVNKNPIIDYRCTGGDNQKWVYTAEGQLRPKGNNKFCMDIEGGEPVSGKKLHLYNCDGGSSEKWAISWNGQFVQATVCLDLDHAITGGSYIASVCGAHDKPNQTFILRKVPDWIPTNN